jgi:hypothetical protein
MIVGIEGIEKDLCLETIQFHRQDTCDTSDEFQRRFPVDTWLDIFTITDITAQTAESPLSKARCRTRIVGKMARLQITALESTAEFPSVQTDIPPLVGRCRASSLAHVSLCL